MGGEGGGRMTIVVPKIKVSYFIDIQIFVCLTNINLLRVYNIISSSHLRSAKRVCVLSRVTIWKAKHKVLLLFIAFQNQTNASDSNITIPVLKVSQRHSMHLTLYKLKARRTKTTLQPSKHVQLCWMGLKK